MNLVVILSMAFVLLAFGMVVCGRLIFSPRECLYESDATICLSELILQFLMGWDPAFFRFLDFADFGLFFQSILF